MGSRALLTPRQQGMVSKAHWLRPSSVYFHTDAHQCRGRIPYTRKLAVSCLKLQHVENKRSLLARVSAFCYVFYRIARICTCGGSLETENPTRCSLRCAHKCGRVQGAAQFAVVAQMQLVSVLNDPCLCYSWLLFLKEPSCGVTFRCMPCD
jgi:hypothetical protein